MLLIFLVYETKFTVGKWQVVVFTAKEERSMGGELGETRGPRSYLKP